LSPDKSEDNEEIGYQEKEEKDKDVVMERRSKRHKS
jgi:hypothetical protein